MGGANPSVRFPMFDCTSPNKDRSPSDLSATIYLRVYASFEFQPMSGNGEHLRVLTTTVEQLLDRGLQEICKYCVRVCSLT